MLESEGILMNIQSRTLDLDCTLDPPGDTAHTRPLKSLSRGPGMDMCRRASDLVQWFSTPLVHKNHLGNFIKINF